MTSTWTTRCGSNACVEIAEVAEGFRVTSSIPGNDEGVTFTPTEMAEFLTEVRMGNFNRLADRARQRQVTAAAQATVA